MYDIRTGQISETNEQRIYLVINNSIFTDIYFE